MGLPFPLGSDPQYSDEYTKKHSKFHKNWHESGLKIRLENEISKYFHLGLRRLSARKLTYAFILFISFIFVFFYAYLPFYFGPDALLGDSSFILEVP